MSFTSIAFLLFLPIVFAAYWLTRNRLQVQNLVLLLASYVFYGWWDWRFLILIIITSVSSFSSGLLIERFEGDRRKRRKVVAANIILNLGILAVFKYYNFFVDTLCELLSPLGITLDTPTLSLILPVGISFYTFQSLSYTIDVYRKKLDATNNIVAFCAFISFFPQLVAGPIERATNLLPQMLRQRNFRYDKAVDGLRQMLWGFFKKMVVADNCALAVDTIWGDIYSMNATTMIAGALLFTFQIYCDFSGYSDIAIGTARLFGISLMQNFRMPYFSRNVSEFWRRWHISLMTWFRDYVYIPLGGSRNGRWTTIRNTLIVFTLSGLWHGANWTYVCWGLYHAVLFVPLLFFANSRKFADEPKICLHDLWRILLTFSLVAVGWIIFRAPSMTDAIAYVSHTMSSFHDIATLQHGKLPLLYCLIIVAAEWIQRRKAHALCLDSGFAARSATVRWAVYLLVAMSIIVLRGDSQTFIYFQF